MTKICLFLSVVLACQCQLIYSTSVSSSTTISETTSSNTTLCTTVTTNGNTVTTCTSNSSVSSTTSTSSVEFIKYLDPIVKSACSSNNLKDKLIEEIQKEINRKGKLVLDLYKNIAILGQELKKKEDFYEKLVNKTLDDAFLPIQKLLQVINFIGDRNLTEESLDALKLIEDAKNEAFKTQRNYGCYAEKLVKLYLEMNTTINNYIRNISLNNIYNKCVAKSPPTCQYYNNFLKCIASELNDFLVFIDTTYTNATQLNITTTIKDIKYRERVENWYKYDAKIQIDTIIKTVQEWILQVLQQNEQAKRRCDEIVLTQIKNHYNDQLPKLTAASKCIADSNNYQKSFNYCKDVYFCGKFEGALSVFINSAIEDLNILEIFKSLSKTYYEKALETFQSYIKSLVGKLDINFQLVQNETNKFDDVRVRLSNPYSLSNICNATNVQSSSYCKCVSNYGSEQIQLLSSIVLSSTQQCGNQYAIMNERKSEIIQFVSNLTSEVKAKAELEAANVFKLNTFVENLL